MRIAVPIMRWGRRYVVTEPCRLYDVGRRNRVKRHAFNTKLITGQKPRFVYEETLIRPAVKKTVRSSGEHRSAIADMNGIRTRTQAYQCRAVRDISRGDRHWRFRMLNHVPLQAPLSHPIEERFTRRRGFCWYAHT